MNIILCFFGRGMAILSSKVFYSCILRIIVVEPNENEWMCTNGSSAMDVNETARLRDADAIYVRGQ